MATQALDLDKDAFMRLVTEEHLQVEGPSAGYLYAGKRGKNGWELYRTPNNPWYLWVYRQVCTQDNVAGGHLVCSIVPATGQVAVLVSAALAASGNRATTAGTWNGSGGISLGSIGATAGCRLNLPSIGANASVFNNVGNSTGMRFGSLHWLYLTVSSAAQTETSTVDICMLLSNDTTPTVHWNASTGTPNPAAAAINSKTLVAMLP